MESEFGVRLRQLRCDNKLKIQEFVDLYNAKFDKNKLSKSIVSRYENGIHLPKRFQIVSNIAQFFNVDTDYLMGRSNEKIAEMNLTDQANMAFLKIPVLMSIDGTGPAYSDETVLETRDSLLNSYKNLFYLKAEDNSMMSFGIIKDSYVLFTGNFIPKSGDIIAIHEKNYPIRIRNYITRGNMTVLFAGHTGINPILIQNTDIESGRINILGKAIKVITLI